MFMGSCDVECCAALSGVGGWSGIADGSCVGDAADGGAASLPERRPGAAARLAKRHPVHQADIRPLTGVIGLIRIDPTHAATVDLTRPLLVVPLPYAPAPGNRLVIDGWHRIHRALLPLQQPAHMPLALADLLRRPGVA